MDPNTILSLFDGNARSQAFQACISKLESASPLDLEALQVCIKLRPAAENASRTANFSNETLSIKAHDVSAEETIVNASSSIAKLYELIVSRIPDEQLDSDHFYKLASILCSDGQFAFSLFKERICPRLVSLIEDVSERAHKDAATSNDAEDRLQQAIRAVTAYLTLLKCSYWLPSRINHVVDHDTLRFLAQFLGTPGMDDTVHDVLSAFLSLLKRKEPIVVATADDTSQTWLKYDSESGQAILSVPLVDASVWDRLSILDFGVTAQNKTTSKIYRTWFQWISQVVIDRVQLSCLDSSIYWDKIRSGLLYGQADQRKYCIGIIRQSLLAARCDISTPTMKFRVSERDAYLKTYDQYSSLFETIVLDRYPNQVQACLPELSKIMRTHITSSMICTLLSAALNPMVQDGVRKPIGNWYIDYVTKIQGDISGHAEFLLEGFLPWATQGDMFTSTLIATRETTASVHGAALAEVVARFIAVSLNTSGPPSQSSSDAYPTTGEPKSRRAIVFGVLDFILDARGKIFQFAILYLLEGLVQGLRACPDALPVDLPLASAELDKILRVSRLPGLPEIAGDLYREFCVQLCELLSPVGTGLEEPAIKHIRSEIQRLEVSTDVEPEGGHIELASDDPMSLQEVRKRLDNSNHRCIQGDSYAPMCKSLIKLLDESGSASIREADLHFVLEALWEEADRRQFVRSVAMHLPSVLFHPVCIQVCVRHDALRDDPTTDSDMRSLLTRAMNRLQQLSEGRIYVLATLVVSVRRATITCPGVIVTLPLEDFILHFVNSPPTIKSEFLFEVAAAEKLQQYRPQRTYHAYYGAREWHAYAAILDLLVHFPKEYVGVAKSILSRLLEPWKMQRPGVPIISKWKNVLQLQVMLILADYCVDEPEADEYLASFKHALTLEPWPRYRFLLEWIIARMCYRIPGKAPHILQDLSTLDDHSSTHIASLMKLAVLVAPRESEDFSARFMQQLVPFAASPKVQIRHESNYAVPIIFDLARERRWKSITENPAFVNLDTFIRTLDKYQSTPWTIRTLKLDAVKDFSLVNIFEGQYLTIESPEKVRVVYGDFVALREADRASSLQVPPQRIPLGERANTSATSQGNTSLAKISEIASASDQTTPAFFQTKSGFDINSLHPRAGPPELQHQRPASVILVASLIDNPTNLGGLSRISESFGLEALYIDDLKERAHKDFKATSVTSEKHFPIHQLKISAVPDFLLDMKTRGYEVVGIEQTDQSSILGVEEEQAGNAQRIGTLPKKCILVLGSEKGGISAEVLAAIDRCVEIRTVGVTRSLNVQTAGGIALYEWWRKWYENA